MSMLYTFLLDIRHNEPLFVSSLQSKANPTGLQLVFNVINVDYSRRRSECSHCSTNESL